MEISKNIFYVGVNDYDIDLFEGQYKVENGMSYNSYVIVDRKIAVMDTVDKHFGKKWLENLEKVLGGKTPDYLVIHHMEPDHSANIESFTEKYPQAKVVSGRAAFVMMKNFFGKDYAQNGITIKEGDTLELGEHSLTFVAAPMVHWPEVMVSYEKSEKTLFSADAFGSFGAVGSGAGVDEYRRYYTGIVGKYGVQVQSLLRKASALDIKRICPLHGEILTDKTGEFAGLYDKWSRYEAEKEGVTIAYTSVYGHTEAAATELGEKLNENGVFVRMFDLARSDMSQAVSSAFELSKLVLATTTYNGEIFPFMREFVSALTERNYQNRTIAVIDNGSWAPQCEKIIKKYFESSKNIVFAQNNVTILSAMNEQNKQQINLLAAELSENRA